MSSVALICLFVCLSVSNFASKGYEQIAMKCHGGAHGCKRIMLLYFGFHDPALVEVYVLHVLKIGCLAVDIWWQKDTGVMSCLGQGGRCSLSSLVIHCFQY